MPPITNQILSDRIHLFRGHKVMLDFDLAKVYGVTTKRLNQQVQRNEERFPEDFMFQLTVDEADSLRLQFATLKPKARGGHRKYLPYAFTEHGAVMVSAVLRTPIAIQASIQIARAFVKLRELVSTQKELAKKIYALERKTEFHDLQIHEIFDAIRALMNIPEKTKPVVGFKDRE